MPEARIPLFLNRGSGSAPADPDAFAHALDPQLAPQPLPADQIPSAIERDTAPVVAVAGGDGTLRAAAEVLAGTERALLVVPTGTLNHFARRLGLEDTEASGAALRAGDVETVALGRFNEFVFLNTLTVGEYAHVLRVRGMLRPFLGKWPAALAGFVAALVRGRVLDLTIGIGDRTVQRHTAFVWIGLGRGAFPLVHEADQDAEPVLEVAVLRARTGLAAAAFLLRLSARVLRGRLPIDDPALEIFHTTQLTLHARHRIDLTADGEIFRLRAPIEVSVWQRALRVLIGPNRGTSSP